MHGLARVTLATTWAYQGLVPKLLVPDSGEQAILAAAGVPPGLVPLALVGLGVAEIALGLLLLVRWRAAWPLWITLLLLPVLLLGALVATPALHGAPFNPATLTLTMLALAVVALVTGRRLPSAANCWRRPSMGGDAGR